MQKLAMIDLANFLMMDEKKAMDFHDVFNRIAEIKGFSESEKMDQLSQFYTDLNVDGRFMTIGSNVWGLKRWYQVDQIDEEIGAGPTKKKKAKKAVKEDDYEEDYDVEEEEEEDLDLVAGFDEEEEDSSNDPLKEKHYDDGDDDDDDDEESVFADGFDIISEDDEDEE